MKKEFHPQLHEVTAQCTCGYSFPTMSTKEDIRTTVCSHCHPFYTGAQKFVDTAGRIERFEQRFKKFQAHQAEAQSKATKSTAQASEEKTTKSKKKTK